MLHAGARRLTEPASQAWLTHPHNAPDWAELVQHFRLALPVPWQQLHHTLVLLQQLVVQTGGQLSAHEANLPSHLAAQAAGLPAATQIHLPWALARMSDNTGYIPATAQEALLQTYLDERLASQGSPFGRPLEATTATPGPPTPAQQPPNARSPRLCSAP